jgi:hypothetical protein
LTDQVKITVIATGFDETRSRLAQMSQTQIQRPVVQGVVSEVSQNNGNKSDNNRTYDDNDNEPPEDNGGKDEDVFGEKFEIPAFLRKIH